jgi:ubiquinone/menaquinone biosynthesis C-methylase UbiE
MKAFDPRDTWVDVDALDDPGRFVRYLDAFNGMAWLRDHKGRALDAFGPQPRGRFLEVGCGAGDDAIVLARRLAGGAVTGLDPSCTMTATATARTEGSGLPLHFITGSGYELPFADASFDGVCSLMTFDILAHPEQALQEMVRVAKPGGRVMVSASDHGSFVIDAPDRTLTRALIEGFCDGMHSGWIGRQLPGMFSRCGLGAIEVTPDTVTLRAADYPVVRPIVLENMVRAAQTHGRIGADEGQRWLNALDDAHACGSFFAASTFFIVSGVKASR